MVETSTPTKLLVLAAAILVVSGVRVALFMHDDMKTAGALPSRDVREIRAAVAQRFGPNRTWFTWANFRRWPGFVRARVNFRIIELQKDSIRRTTIHPDGTKEDSTPVFVRFKSDYWPQGTCWVERNGGRWTVNIMGPRTFDIQTPAKRYQPGIF